MTKHILKNYVAKLAEAQIDLSFLPNSGKDILGITDGEQEPKEEDLYYIVTEKCTECVGFHDEPQCAAVCPVDCCVDDEDNEETEDELLAKKDFMHL